MSRAQSDSTVDDSLSVPLTINPHEPSTDAQQQIRQPSQAEISKLLTLGLFYSKLEPAILCIQCRFALKTDAERVTRHHICFHSSTTL